MSLLAGQTASGLDIKLYHNSVMTNPTSISCAIYNASDVPVVSGDGTALGIGHYDASALTIPSGYVGDASIIWTFLSPSNVSGTATESFTITDTLTTSFNYDMGNVWGIIEDVKLDMGLSSTTFTGAQYIRFIQKTLRRLNRKLRYVGTSDALSYSSSTHNISPALNDNIRDLIILQIECMISKERRRDAVGKGIRVKDGDTEIDTTASFGGHSAVVQDYCGELKEALDDFILHNIDSPADNADVVWYANRKIEADMDHDGEGSDATIVHTSPFENRTGLSVTMR